MRFSRALILAGGLGCGLALGGRAAWADEPDAVAVNARVFNGYTGTRLPDGTYQPQHYAFGEGGQWQAGRGDPSIDQLPFRAIAEAVAGPLRRQAYLPGTDPKQTELLILVYWGLTVGAEHGEYGNALGQAAEANHAAMGPMGGGGDLTADLAAGELTSALMMSAAENRLRDRNNLINGHILGYADEYVRAIQLRESGRQAWSTSYDAARELEEDRYFVVLKAYDFPLAQKEKKLKLLWEIRYSIEGRGNKFDEKLPAMTRSAARYFGQATDGLVHEDLPAGKVRIGTPTVVEPAPKPAADARP
jgi:hypothetical protein